MVGGLGGLGEGGPEEDGSSEHQLAGRRHEHERHPLAAPGHPGVVTARVARIVAGVVTNDA
ncbi:hypothetical protein GCM10009741_29410 [Kribbella lupini]|uniref:Uncharacterized protein n=1 Tax=Kribbella lupini TaxID=291602 RepID=A0ABP4LKE2_9ACTN